uniref:Uncharacterized protein n=1 Tax=Varanus komodoensis TaxID=61221 RepID=A0A8D2LLB0_VARKO
MDAPAQQHQPGHPVLLDARSGNPEYQGTDVEEALQGKGGRSRVTLTRAQRNRRASRSDSNSVRTSPSRTGPLTLRMIERLVSSMNSTRTCIGRTSERFPVRPSTLVTRASLMGCTRLPWAGFDLISSCVQGILGAVVL